MDILIQVVIFDRHFVNKLYDWSVGKFTTSPDFLWITDEANLLTLAGYERSKMLPRNSSVFILWFFRIENVSFRACPQTLASLVFFEQFLEETKNGLKARKSYGSLILCRVHTCVCKPTPAGSTGRH